MPAGDKPSYGIVTAAQHAQSLQEDVVTFPGQQCGHHADNDILFAEAEFLAKGGAAVRIGPESFQVDAVLEADDGVSRGAETEQVLADGLGDGHEAPGAAGQVAAPGAGPFPSSDGSHQRDPGAGGGLDFGAVGEQTGVGVEKGHMLWKGDREKIKQLVESLYAAGVSKVYAAGISKEGETEIVAEFMAELPADAAQRVKIFQMQTDFWKSYIDEPNAEDLAEVSEKDTGQKYLFFNFDL